MRVRANRVYRSAISAVALAVAQASCSSGDVAPRGSGAGVALGKTQAALSTSAAPETLSLALDLEGRSVRVELERLAAPTGSNYQHLGLGPDGRLVALPSRLGCAYRGRTETLGDGSAPSETGWAVLDACSAQTVQPLGSAVRGVIRANGRFWRIEPDASDSDATDGVAHRAQPLVRRDTPGLVAPNVVPATVTRELWSAPRRLEFREGTSAETKYVELVVVNDAARADSVGSAVESDTVLFVAAMNALLEDSGLVPRVRVTLRAQVTFDADPYVPAFSGDEVDHDSLLEEFLDWANAEDGLPDHDEHVLLSGLDFLGATAGYAGLSVACSSSSNGLIVQADDAGGGFAVLSAVHELGHTLGMDHDDGSPCPTQGFIMAAVGCANCPIDGAEFSSCSTDQFGDYLAGPAYAEGLRCADDVPVAPGVASCGDGVVSGSETCDCGASDCSGIDPCCNGATCRLDGGAECSDFNDACCQGCQVVTGANVVCRAQRSECDLAEVCSGSSKDCPADTFLPAGEVCEDERGNDGACYLGDCRSRGTQCEQIAEQQGFDGVGVPPASCGTPCDQVICGNQPSGCIIINGGPTVIDGVPCAGGGQCVDQQCVTIVDQCPADPAKAEPGDCGCGTPDTDGDGDGAADCVDACPDNAGKIAAGECGCGASDADSDDDRTADCDDGCPTDASKSDPGECGCNTPDTDTDADSTADCNDGCPDDESRTAPGACGCGAPSTDTDQDGTPDCDDDCPADGLRLAEPCGPPRDAEGASMAPSKSSGGGGCTLSAPQPTLPGGSAPLTWLLLGLPLMYRRARRAATPARER